MGRVGALYVAFLATWLQTGHPDARILSFDFRCQFLYSINEDMNKLKKLKTEETLFFCGAEQHQHVALCVRSFVCYVSFRQKKIFS